jgi:hypothetical protein
LILAGESWILAEESLILAGESLMLAGESWILMDNKLKKICAPLCLCLKLKTGLIAFPK